MGWLNRLFDRENGGSWDREVDKHVCPLPQLTRAIGGVNEWGGSSAAGFEQIAAEGDRWTCRCGSIWEVEAIEVWPPGSRSRGRKGTGARVLQWSDTYLRRITEW